MNGCTSYPEASKSAHTSSNTNPPDQLTRPRTFSPTTQRGEASRITLSISGHRWRSSSFPRRFPALLYGWHGNPPEITSTDPRQAVPSKSRMSLYILASGKFFFRIFWQNGFHSTWNKLYHPANSAAKSKPPMPEKSDPCFIKIDLPITPLSLPCCLSVAQAGNFELLPRTTFAANAPLRDADVVNH